MSLRCREHKKKRDRGGEAGKTERRPTNIRRGRRPPTTQAEIKRRGGTKRNGGEAVTRWGKQKGETAVGQKETNRSAS